MDKRVYSGSMFSAGEFGGILIHPEARRAGEPFSGCYEKYASTTALVRMAREYSEGLDNGRKDLFQAGGAGCQADRGFLDR